jgi:hypothetical protein
MVLLKNSITVESLEVISKKLQDVQNELAELGKPVREVDVEYVEAGTLTTGQYAITHDETMGVLCVSNGSFKPRHEFYAYIVNLADGIGSFLTCNKVRICTKEEAFEVASR